MNHWNYSWCNVMRRHNGRQSFKRLAHRKFSGNVDGELRLKHCWSPRSLVLTMCDLFILGLSQNKYTSRISMFWWSQEENLNLLANLVTCILATNETIGWMQKWKKLLRKKNEKNFQLDRKLFFSNNERRRTSLNGS